MGYWLGVDLGTTYTSAAVRIDDRVEVVRLGGRHAEIPSEVFIEPDGAMLVGEAAQRRGVAEPLRLVREFKRRVGDPVPLFVAGTPYPAHALMGRLLEHVVTTVTNQQGEPPTGITVTCPANWGPYKRELLEHAIRIANLDRVTLLTEPEAAAVQYAAGEHVQPGETIAVYDLGGGTFDAAVLRKTDTGFAVLGQPEGIEQLGGVDFDEAVFRHVKNAVGDPASRVDPSDKTAIAAYARLRRDCVEAKEALSYDTDVVIPVALPDLHTEVRLTRPEFEAMISPALALTIACLRRALRHAQVESHQLRTALLTGGSSRIPVIGELIRREFRCPVMLDSHPEHTIALGAARVSAISDPSHDASPPLQEPSDASPQEPSDAPPPEPSDAPTTPGEPPVPPRRGLLIAVTAAVVILLIGAGTFFAWPRVISSPSPSGPTSSVIPTPSPGVLSTAPAPTTTISSSLVLANCIPVTVAASSEKAALMTQLAARYNTAGRAVNGECFKMVVNSVASGTAEAALATGWDPAVNGDSPDVWTPAASTWVSLLRNDLQHNGRPDITPNEPPSLASTPLVLAMPEPMATALGWPGTPIGWSDVLNLANDPQGWASKGHPEWGRFALGKTNPTVSTSGLAATIGALVAATGTSADLNLSRLKDPAVQKFLADVERSVIHYGDTTLTYLTNLQHADDAGTALGYLSAVAVEEKSVLDYNAGNPSGDPATLGKHSAPTVPLVAVYPKEGTLYSDNPYLVLKGSSPDKQTGAADFLNYLLLPEQQQVFADANFRTADHRPGTPITASPYVIPDGVKVTLTPPDQQVLTAVRDLWAQVRKPARVLLLLDVSGSMADPSGVGNTSKLDLAKAAATAALSRLSDTDRVGLWTFTTNLSTPDGITNHAAPIAALGENRGPLTDTIAALTPLDGTPLYAATRSAAEEMKTTADPGDINAVVVLTDGRNEYTDDQNLADLLQQVSDDTAQDGVRIFSIAYGPDSDLPVLKQISEAGRAAAYDAQNPASIGKVFDDVLSNF